MGVGKFQISPNVNTVYEPYTGGKPSPSPEYPQQLTDSVPGGSYYVPSTALDGGYWRIDLSESLGGLGEYKDAVEVDAFTGRYRIVRKTATGVLDGTEAWNVSGKYPPDQSDWYYSSSKYVRVAANKSDGRVKATTYPFAIIANNNNAGIGIGLTWGNVRIRYGDEETIDALKAKLAANPVSIRYELEQPIITTGQAIRVTSTAGLSESNVVSMGLTAPDPEHPCEITIPNTLSIRHCGKNLLDKANAYYAGYSRGIPYIRNENIVSLPYRADYRTQGIAYVVPCVANQTYYLSCVDRIPYQRIGIGEYGSIEQAMCSGTELGGRGGFGETPNNIVYRAKENGVLICFIGSQYDNSTDENIATITGNEKLQLELWEGEPRAIVGDDATTFETYCGEDVSVGGPQDFVGGEINVTGGDVMVRLGRCMLDGSENWVLYKSSTEKWIMRGTGILQNVHTPSRNSEMAKNMMCSHYKADSIDSPYMNRVAAGISRAEEIHIFDPEYQDVAAWKAYLAAEYAAGHPVTVYYRLQIPTAHAIQPTSICALQGCNTITTDADSLSVSGHADPVHIISDLSARLAALEETTATQN